MSVSANPDRRDVIIGGAAVVGATVVPKAFAATGGLAPAGDLIGATRAFLGKLTSDQRKAASFAWDGPEWQRWNYFGGAGYIKPGFRLEQMNADQKAAAWDLLATVLSPAGVQKAKTVMLLQDVLAAMGVDADKRNSQRFSFAVFGTPAETGVWGFRLEGHHLHHSFTVRDGAIASVTPASFSSLPNRVTAGAHAGLVTLKEEESLARQLVGDLAPKRQEKARVSPTPLGNILSYAGRERANSQKIGLAAADLTAAQRDILWRLIDTYTADHLPPALAAAQRARVRSGDREAVHFAWYGPNTPEKAFGYRVIADGFVVELGS